MYTRITTSGGRSYLQLVEGHRDAEGKVRIKVVANLCRLDKLTPGKLDPLINGLNRAAGRLENTANEITHEPAQGFGDVFALHELWKQLGFDRTLARAVRSGKRKIDVEALVPEVRQKIGRIDDRSKLDVIFSMSYGVWRS